MNRFVFTCGDINGIGPEIVQKTLNRVSSEGRNKFYYLCPAEVFEKVLETLPPEFDYQIINKLKSAQNDNPSLIEVVNIKQGRLKLQTGIPSEVSGKISYKAIKMSFEMTSSKLTEAIVTAPISKEALGMAGIHFPGHTEMYAEWSGIKDYVMMFLSSRMKCALLTIHEPVKNVPKLITSKRLSAVLGVVIQSLKNDFNIIEPSIAVLGLNPHAGEKGRIGKEEQNIIIPAIKQPEFKETVSGPFVPDAFFANRLYKKYDMVLGMYHDQVLIPFKLLNFSSGVNYTAGLPIIRTSPDHGTAFDIAGKNVADEGSFLEAYYLAGKILKNRKRHNG